MAPATMLLSSPYRLPRDYRRQIRWQRASSGIRLWNRQELAYAESHQPRDLTVAWPRLLCQPAGKARKGSNAAGRGTEVLPLARLANFLARPDIRLSHPGLGSPTKPSAP